jgi:hypothetical protein
MMGIVVDRQMNGSAAICLNSIAVSAPASACEAENSTTSRSMRHGMSSKSHG